VIRGLSVVAALAVLSFRLPGQTVVISGSAKDCFVPGQERGVPALDVRAIDPSTNSTLVGVLHSLDTLNMIGPPPASANWNSAYNQLKSLWGTTTALTHDSTSSTGSFSLTIPSMDSVLVLTFAEVEDANAYYQYEMVGARSSQSLLFDMSGAGCGLFSDVTNGGQGTIQRTVAGLIFQDDFNRVDGAPGSNWEIQGNPSFWSITGNVLRAHPTAATLQQILVANSAFGAARGEMVVQARMRRVGTARTAFPGIQARHDAAGAGSFFRWVITNSWDASTDEFHRTLAGGNTILSTSPSYPNNPWQQYKLAVRDSQQQGWKDGVLRVNLADAALNGVTGRAGFSSGWYTSTSDYHEFDDFAVYTRNVVTMSGLPPGYKLRVGTRTAVGAGGTATADLLEDLCPRANIEVLDASGLVIARLTPSGGVWGGDSYSYTP
jgi:hypothetical protein